MNHEDNFELGRSSKIEYFCIRKDKILSITQIVSPNSFEIIYALENGEVGKKTYTRETTGYEYVDLLTEVSEQINEEKFSLWTAIGTTRFKVIYIYVNKNRHRKTQEKKGSSSADGNKTRKVELIYSLESDRTYTQSFECLKYRPEENFIPFMRE